MEISPQQKIINRCKEVVEKAQRVYGVDLSKVRISFDLRGRAAGMAGGRISGTAEQCYVKFNRDMLTREAFDHVHDETVPHEYAHIICFMHPSMGRNHDHGWAAICRKLGGSGERTHKEDVVHGKGTTYEYITDRGHKVRIGDRHHAYLQTGRPLTFKRGKGTITNACAYSIVGRNGRSLPTPIVIPGKAAPISTVPLPDTRTYTYPTAPVQQPPVQRATPPVQRLAPGESKAATSRRIMLSGYRGGQSYETIITAMMIANGYDRQLARATFKANAAKAGIPDSFC